MSTMSSQCEILLAVVSNQPERLAGKLAPWLEGFGRTSCRHCSPVEFSAAALAPGEIVVADFASLDDSGRDALALALPENWPVLGLFSGDGSRQASGGAARCSEVLVGPGAAGEFAAKLERLRRLAAPACRLEEALTLKLNLVGESAAFARVVGEIGKFSRCAAPVLILGETGTGKERIARAIHYLGANDGKPFVGVNCGALPDSLVENEFFGHVRGAYTDAREAQTGLIEQAEGGTLFLDEIEALTGKGQVALLRFLQDYEYRPLGAPRTRKAHLRLITASNEPLERLVAEGGFRKDLYYRINILSLQLPPLRERAGDVRLLAEHFVDRYRETYRQFDKYLAPQTLEWMARYDWPGNIRELENLILREFLLAESACIAIAPPGGGSGERRNGRLDRRFRHLLEQSFQDAKAEVVGEFERSYLRHVLEIADGNVSEAARQAGKDRRSFAKLLEKHRVNRKPSGVE